MIIYVPLDIPKIEPNNWDEWWEVWHTHAFPIKKARSNHNDDPEESPWKGFDLYRKNDSVKRFHVYDAVLAPQVPVVLNLVEQIKTHCIFDPWHIRVIENTIPVDSHSDYDMLGKYEFRSILWNTYQSPIWQFAYESETRDLVMPEDTNSFYYSDKPVKHSSVYSPNFSKGLLKVYGTLKPNAKEIIDRSLLKYKDIAWIL